MVNLNDPPIFTITLLSVIAAKAETFDDIGDLSGLIEAGEKALGDKSSKEEYQKPP